MFSKSGFWGILLISLSVSLKFINVIKRFSKINFWKIVLLSEWGLNSLRIFQSSVIVFKNTCYIRLKRLVNDLIQMLDIVFGLKGRVVLILHNDREEELINQLSSPEPGILWGGKFFFRLRFSVFRHRRSVWRIKIMSLNSLSRFFPSVLALPCWGRWRLPCW